MNTKEVLMYAYIKSIADGENHDSGNRSWFCSDCGGEQVSEGSDLMDSAWKLLVRVDEISRKEK